MRPRWLAEGVPRAAPLFYLAAEGLRLYWLSSASSEHSRNLERNSQAALAVYRPTRDWKKIRGVQMRGTVSVVSQRGLRDDVVKRFQSRFRLDSSLEPAIRRSKVYCFEPEWIRYIDNSKAFGYQFEVPVRQESGTIGGKPARRQ